MPLARTAGRKGRPWERLRRHIFATKGDLCVWCGHPGSNAINHDDGYTASPETRMDPDRCSPIHGVEGCPHCPRVWSRQHDRLVPPNCNSIVGARPLAVALAQRAMAVRDW